MSEEDDKKKSEEEKVAEEPLKETDTLPSEAETKPKKKPRNKSPKRKPPKNDKIIGLMGVEHQAGPPGSSHG